MDAHGARALWSKDLGAFGRMGRAAVRKGRMGRAAVRKGRTGRAAVRKGRTAVRKCPSGTQNVYTSVKIWPKNGDS